MKELLNKIHNVTMSKTGLLLFFGLMLFVVISLTISLIYHIMTIQDVSYLSGIISTHLIYICVCFYGFILFKRHWDRYYSGDSND